MAIDNTKKYKVKNRSASNVIYSIPDLNIRKSFQPGEVLQVTFEEIERLSFQPGGKELIYNYLQIEPESAEQVNGEIGIVSEDEYYMTEDQIIDMLKNGSNDQLMDCLDFAPVGVIELVKKYVTELPVTDMTKLEIIKNKTGYDGINAMKHIQEDEEEQRVEANPKSDGKITVAGAASADGSGKSERRTTSNYKITTIGNSIKEK